MTAGERAERLAALPAQVASSFASRRQASRPLHAVRRGAGYWQALCTGMQCIPPRVATGTEVTCQMCRQVLLSREGAS